MQASSLTTRLKRRVTVRDWLWWRLPVMLRSYVAAVPALAMAAIAFEAVKTDWRVSDAVKFALLLCCAVISVASTPRIMYAFPGLTRDLSGVWILPTAILLPPVYAALMPIPMLYVMWRFVHRGVPHRSVFTAASLSLGYGLISWIFRSFPPHFAGPAVGTGSHALTWVLAVVISNLVGSRVHHFLLVGAVKLSDPSVRIRDIEWTWHELQAVFVEVDIGAVLTLVIASAPQLIVVAFPTVLLMRRFVVYPVLIAQARVDAKTGLLNVSTWEAEAEVELSRAVRTRQPVSIALVDIDHFKSVNDTYGHLVGDRVLKAIANALATQSRDYDRVGRFGGEEFVLLLPQTVEGDATRIAERLRRFVEGMQIPIDERPEAPLVKVTISIGVTAMAQDVPRALTDLLAAADSALYQAKQAGRNRVAAAVPADDMGMQAALSRTAPAADPMAAALANDPLTGDTSGPGQTRQTGSQVQVDPTLLSLCLIRLLSVLSGAHREFAAHLSWYPTGCSIQSAKP
jgi:diguanylate cyclase (GGDEF)-like protein